MIKSFEDFEHVEVSIIPKLREFNELTLSKGDTLVVYWDFINYPMEMEKNLISFSPLSKSVIFFQ